MMPIKISLSLISFFFLLNLAMAQNLDSMELCLQSDTLSYEQRIKLYDDLSWEYVSLSVDKSTGFARRGIRLAQKENDDLMVCRLYRYMGISHYTFSQYDSAFIYLDKAMYIAEKIESEDQFAAIYTAKGNIYNVQGKYDMALDYYLKALPIFEKNEQKYRVRITLSNIGALYNGMKNYDQAEYYYNKSNELAAELNDLWGLAQNYDGLSSIYLDRKAYDKALASELEAYELYKSLNYPVYETVCLSGIAQIYYKGFNNLKLAREYAQKSLNLADSIGAPNYIASSLCMLSNVAYHEGNYKACVEYAHKAFETDSSDYNMLTNILGNMVTGNIQLGNTNEAIKYFNLYTKSINEAANNDFLTAMSEMEVKYETEKKTIKITALEKQKKLYKYLILSTLVSLLFLTILIIYRHILSKKEKLLTRQKIIQLEQEKKLVATQAVLEGETAERTRLAKDLHDGLGGMLSVVKLNLNGMKNYSVLESENVDQFNKTVNMLDNSIKELRRIAHHMMPESLLRY
ncbi:MAG: tetratricopeptide repeat protein, partial [Prolixibacteraceae bacterium]|nr:tetratricopeptide repeat protein [Prolixibacteraceae bacterium]